VTTPVRRGLTLDAGALILLERGDGRVRSLLRRAVEQRLPVSVPAGVVAQAWRGGPRQARVARLLADPGVRVAVLDDPTARAVGLLAGRSGHGDVVDVSVVLCALERDDTVVTTDPGDIRSVAPDVAMIEL
jgi:hypothetical protein